MVDLASFTGRFAYHAVVSCLLQASGGRTQKETSHPSYLFSCLRFGSLKTSQCLFCYWCRTPHTPYDINQTLHFLCCSLAGVSRSTTMVVAYLMTVTHYSWEECLSAVKAVRSFVGPNYGFQQQLQEYQMTQVSEVNTVRMNSHA